jgi:hypothetical protein
MNKNIMNKLKIISGVSLVVTLLVTPLVMFAADSHPHKSAAPEQVHSAPQH